MPVANDLPQDIFSERMKTMRALGVLLFGVLFQTTLLAQTVNFLVVSKSHTFTQTGNDILSVVETANPWSFEAHV